MGDQNAYILGTDKEELHRLGVQHQVWASEAQRGWHLANFSAGHTILDLGCGPGFCTKELAFVAGNEGKVIGIDRSVQFIRFLDSIQKQYQLNIESHCTDFNDMQLEPMSIDGMFCRWALAWIPNPKEILQKVFDALKPGGKMVIHEYYDWSTHQTEPRLPALSYGISQALKSFKDQDGEIDIGREIPQILEELEMKNIQTRSMTKLARSTDLEWQWPKTFYYSYFPRLAELGYLNTTEVQAAWDDLNKLENMSQATFCCPLMIEVIAEK